MMLVIVETLVEVVHCTFCSKTIGGWLEQVRSRVCDPSAVGKTETSWQIFLRIIGELLLYEFVIVAPWNS